MLYFDNLAYRSAASRAALVFGLRNKIQDLEAGRQIIDSLKDPISRAKKIRLEIERDRTQRRLDLAVKQ